MNEFQIDKLESSEDGFYTVRRKNNPLRKQGLVHRDLGKIGEVSLDRVKALAGKLASKMQPFAQPLVIGLSESSILLGRVVCELFGGKRFIFSTRYPITDKEMVPFVEPHSHAPEQFLMLAEVSGVKELCIVEDELTTGRTLMNLIQVLAENIPSLARVNVLALKILCSNARMEEMMEAADGVNVKLAFFSLYHQYSFEEYFQHNLLTTPLTKIDSPVFSSESKLERERGRINILKSESISLRYEKWERMLANFNLPESVTIVGASEAIDLAFEIAQVLHKRGHKAFIRHLTISPWEVPGWEFSSNSPGIKSLYIYMPPVNGGTYLIVYDQLFQEKQVNELAKRLVELGGEAYVLRGEDYV